MNSRILFVDDSRQVLESMRRILRPMSGTWSVFLADDPVEALELLEGGSFDAVVSDIKMPRLNGLQLLERIKANDSTRDVPVVMLTGLGDRDLKRKALELGAADLLNKPVEPEDLIARIRSVLRLKAYEDELRTQNVRLEQRVRERTEELYQSRLNVIWRLAKAAEHRDNETGNHVIRVGCMCRALAKGLGMDSDFVETLFIASPLHDIGKIGIPDAILLKQGPLSDAQRHVMMRHCWIGERILKEDAQAAAVLAQFRTIPWSADSVLHCNPLIEMAARIALTHHEKWDGSGYPQGLVGDSIPVESRITAIVDVFDAVLSRRPYKPPFSEDKAMSIIDANAGSHFDPEVHRAFRDVLPELRRIRSELSDSPLGPSWENICDASNLVRG